MALRNPRLSANVHLLSIENDQPTTPDDSDPLSKYIWDQTADIRQKALHTYFVQGIGDGTLNPTSFGGYMVQDSVYCYLTKGSIEVAERRATQDDLKQYLQHEGKSYERYYTTLWQKWPIANVTGIKLGDACKMYTAYEHTVASDMDTIYFIVALIPCLKLWPWLGQQLQGKNHGVYTDWFNDNFDPTYKGYEKLDAFVDAAAQVGKIDKAKALQVYKRCMEGEFAFFNAPLKM